MGLPRVNVLVCVLRDQNRPIGVGLDNFIRSKYIVVLLKVATPRLGT
jgi:hypothetical protein